jgi:hypothetical protein
MRVLLIIMISCGVIAIALALGVLRPGLTSATLQRHAQGSVMRCMHDAGFDQDHALPGSLTVGQALSPRDRALERCWSDAAKDPEFQRLALIDPVAFETQRRDEGFNAWRCVERSGYVRTTAIPLSGPDGYPLQLAAGNFDVGPSVRDVERFYRAAANCSGDPIDEYRAPDGAFSPGPADGTRCIHHEHGGSGRHAHGCYSAATYPDRSEGAKR